MKRPEGFDQQRRPAQPTPPGGRRGREAPPAGRGDREATVSRPPARPRPEGLETPSPAAARPAKAAKVAKPPKEPKPEREARRAERIRKRYEKQELKRFTRRQRRRRIGWLVGAGVLALLVGLIATAVYSPILALREVRVDGTARLDPTVVADAVSGQVGTPLALLDEDRLRDELAEFTLIRSYATELVPPDTLVIHVVERAPIGVVQSSAGFDVIDPAGVVIESAAERPAGLPLLTVDEDGVDGVGFRGMVEVLLALPPDLLAQVDAIAARTRDDVTLALTGSTQRVRWGSAEDSDAKARVLAAMLPHFSGGGPGEYDVSSPGAAVFDPD